MAFWDFLKKKRQAAKAKKQEIKSEAPVAGSEKVVQAKPIQIAGKTKYCWGKNIIWEPVLTEKGQASAQKKSVVFKVASTANKTEIKQAIEKIFNVRVETVRTENNKRRERGRLRIRSVRPKFKKAYVKLKEGYKIALFE